MAGLPSGWQVSAADDKEKALMLQSAGEQRAGRGKDTPFTRAGRELTQHPHIVGLGAADGTTLGLLMKRYGGEAGINRVSMQRISSMLDNATCIRRFDMHEGPVIEFYDAVAEAITPQTNGVRFSGRDYRFLGFLGRPRE